MSWSGPGAPNAAGLPATRRTRSRSGAAEVLARQRAPLQRAELRVPLPVRRHPVDHLLDHPSRLAEGGDDPRHRREVGGDLDATDAVAVDQRAPVTEGVGARVVEGVEHLAPEPLQSGGDVGLAEATGRDDHAVEVLAVHDPSGGQPDDGSTQPDPLRDPKCSA